MSSHRTSRFCALGGALLLLAALTGVGRAHAAGFFETSDGDVDEGNRLLGAGKPADALRAYEAARASLPESAALHLNLGLAQAALGDHAAASAALTRALDQAEGPLYGAVLYNLGTVHARWAEALEKEAEKDPAQGAKASESWQKAVYYLERAAVESPGNRDILRNLEFALLRVDPPCYAKNDRFEPNDQPDQAKPFPLAAPGGDPAASGQPAGPGGIPPQAPGGGAPGPADGAERGEEALQLCAEDIDYFAVELGPGDRLSARVKTAEGAEPGAQLGVSLFDAQGTLRRRPPPSATAPLSEFDYRAVGQSETVLLRVDNLSGIDTPYTLSVRRLADCTTLEDPFEDNDTPETARAVTPDMAEALQSLRLCPGDSDYFAVELEPGYSLVALMESRAEQGAPRLEIQDATGLVVAHSAAALEGAESASAQPATPTGADAAPETAMAVLLEPPAGRYLVHVGGSIDAEAAYSLTLQVVPPCPEGNDPLEENQTRDTAKAVERDKPQLLRICPGDDDWLALELQPDETLAATIAFDHERGDLLLEAYKPALVEPAQVSDRSGPKAGGESVALKGGKEAETWQLHVRAVVAGGQNFYVLRVNAPQNQGGGGDSGQENEPKPPEEKDEPQQPPEEQKNPLEDDMARQDRNPRNLQAEQVKRALPPQLTEPEFDW